MSPTAASNRRVFTDRRSTRHAKATIRKNSSALFSSRTLMLANAGSGSRVRPRFLVVLSPSILFPVSWCFDVYDCRAVLCCGSAVGLHRVSRRMPICCPVATVCHVTSYSIMQAVPATARVPTSTSAARWEGIATERVWYSSRICFKLQAAWSVLVERHVRTRSSSSATTVSYLFANASLRSFLRGRLQSIS